MKTKTIQCLYETWHPEPVEIPVGNILVKEGKNLANSVTEDIGGFSLAPNYSARDLRRIKRLKHKNRQLIKSARKQRGLIAKW